ncbi:MAG TPA: M48 family metallopeptidase [Caulifigura sp.]|jgi:predicted Zn-dependent protease|nr:M48 family metallopeptidase [Caulifigura sp.]
MAGSPRYRLTRTALLAAACVSSAGCQSALLNSAANALGTHLPALAMTDSEEQQLGAQSYAELLRTSKPTSHPEYQAMVEQVGRRIADVADRPDFNWEFTVLAGPTQNAFCLPGGKVVVYEGLLPLCENEAGLAVVMSHEIAHAVARHGGQRVREQAVVDAVGDVVGDAVKNTDEQKKLLVETAYGMGTQVGVLLPFSRSQETQADSIGLMLMARAGYNPEEAPRFWKRFQSSGKSGIPELLSTHPADERRASNLIDLLPQAERYYAAVEKKLDRGAPIANSLTTPTNATVASSEASMRTPAPAATGLVPTARPTPTETRVTSAKPAPAWIGAPAATEPAATPAAAAAQPAEPEFSPPVEPIAAEVDSGNPFLTPAATTTPVSDSGWTPTVH